MFRKDGGQVGLQNQHHLQVKRTWAPYSSRVNSNNYHNDCGNHAKKLFLIPCIKWNCPPKFTLNSNWRVASGQETQEAETQKDRETRVIEAVYHHVSAIPPSPSLSLEVESFHPDDSCIPLIPMNPVEEMEGPTIASNKLQEVDMPRGTLKSGPLDIPVKDPPFSSKATASVKPDRVTEPALEGDVMAAASAAFTAIMKSKEQGSLIDTELLIQILSNPELIKKLMNELGLPINGGSEPASILNQVISSAPFSSSNTDLGIRESSDGHMGYVHVSAPQQVRLSTPSSSSKNAVQIKVSNGAHTISSGTGSLPISEPKLGTPYVPLPIIRNNLELRNSCDELRKGANTGFAPLSVSTLIATKRSTDDRQQARVGTSRDPWSPSIPFSSSRSDEIVIKNLMNEVGRDTHVGMTQKAGLKPVTQLALLCNSKPDVSVIKNLINKYGDSTRTEAQLVSNFKPPSVPLPTPQSIAGTLPKPNTLPPDLEVRPISPEISWKAPLLGTTAPPVKDSYYYRSLIKQHGDRQENMNHDALKFGELPNYPRGSVQVNKKSIESNPQHRKHCLYFNTAKGCLKGSACPFQHIMANVSSPAWASQAPHAKRMKREHA